jgi:hypothetical protein
MPSKFESGSCESVVAHKRVEFIVTRPVIIT